MFGGGIVYAVVPVKPFEVFTEWRGFDGGDGNGPQCLYHALCSAIHLIGLWHRESDGRALRSEELAKGNLRELACAISLVTAHDAAGLDLQGLDGSPEFAVGVSLCPRCVH